MDNSLTIEPVVSYRWRREGVFFHLIWLILVSGTFYCYLNLDWFFTPTYTPIATLLEQVGTVQFRPLDLSLWKETNIGQGFYEGEILATAENSKAVISLQDGKTLELDGNSQVKITLQQGEIDKFLLVTLLKGRATTKTVPHDTVPRIQEAKPLYRRVQVISGKQAIDVERSADFRVEKPVDQVTPLIEVMHGKVSVSTPSTGVHQELQESPLRPAFTPPIAPQVELPKILALSHLPPISVMIESFAPRIQLKWPTDRMRIWTKDSLETAAFLFPFSFHGIEKKSDIQKWRPSVQADAKHIWTAEEKSHIPVVEIPWAELKEIAHPSSDALFPTQLVQVSIGGVIKKRYANTEEKGEYYTKPIQLAFSSFQALEGRSILLQLSAISLEASHSIWVTEASSSASSGGPSLFLQNGADLSALFPFLSPPVAFSIQPQDAIPTGESLVFIRNEKLIASLAGHVDQVDKVKKIRNYLQASVVYKGKPEDFLSLISTKESGSTQEILLETLRNHRNLFILVEGKLVKIDSQLLRKNRSALSFIEGMSRIAFLREVEIIDREK